MSSASSQSGKNGKEVKQGLVIGAVGGLLSFIPCIGWIIAWAISAIAGVYLGAVYAHLFGQVGANPVNLYTSQA